MNLQCFDRQEKKSRFSYCLIAVG